MIYILSIVLCFAVGVMLAYHLYGICWGETSVEGQDHEEYRRKAKERNEVRLLQPTVGLVLNLFTAICKFV